MSFQANAKISPTGGHATAALVARAAAGDRDAFATLYNDYKGEVVAFLFKRTRDRHLTEDLTSEVFVRALRNIGAFTTHPGGGGFGAWVNRIARNAYLDHVKAARTRLEVSVAEMYDGDDRDRSAESSALRELDIAAAAATVTTAMKALTPYQRLCIQLRYLDDLSVQEAAARLGRPIGATKTLTFRALKRMRAELAVEAAEAVTA